MSPPFTEVLQFPDEFPPVSTGALLQDRGLLITGHSNGLLIQWQLKDKSHKVLHECASPVETISVSVKGEVAVGCNSGLLFVFHIDAPSKKTVLQEPTYSVLSRVWRTLWVSENDLISTSTYGVVSLIKRTQEEWERVPLSGHSDSVFGIDSFNGKYVATGDYRGNILVWGRKEDNQYELVDKHTISRIIEDITWTRDGAFVTLDRSGRISFFEPADTGRWRLTFQTDTATGTGNSVATTSDGKTVLAGTQNELIQLELESQAMAQFQLEKTVQIFPEKEGAFILTLTGLFHLRTEKIEIPANFLRYLFAKISLLGRTGVGKSSLCSVIVTGSPGNVQSTFGRRVWEWNVKATPPKRFILVDYGGQEAVMQTFLPFLADSDIVLVFFKQKDVTTFQKATELVAELPSYISPLVKVFLVQTHIDDPMNEIDDEQVKSLKVNGKIIDRLLISSTDRTGIDELKDRMLAEVSWQHAKTMIESQEVDSLTRLISGYQTANATIVGFQEIRNEYEKRTNSKISKSHFRFLLLNLSSQGLIEYYPDILDAVIFNDKKYNELKTRIPILADQRKGIISIKELEATFKDEIQFVRILDEVYSSTRISIINGEKRIFPFSLKSTAIEIPKAFEGYLKPPVHQQRKQFPDKELNIGRLLEALSELKLQCIDASQTGGLFAWEKNACVYYTFQQTGDDIQGRRKDLTYYVGGEKRNICDRLLKEFSSVIEGLYGPEIKTVEESKKKFETLKFDVALSFAGEQRDYVRQVAEILSAKGIKIFYDEFQRSQLWGRHLPEYFQQVYYANSRWCIMFISADYVSKMWPSQERKYAIDREVEQFGGYILPVRFDGTPVPGLSTSIRYEDATKVTPQQLADLFLQKFEAEAE